MWNPIYGHETSTNSRQLQPILTVQEAYAHRELLRLEHQPRNRSISAKKLVLGALTQYAHNVCTSLELVAKEMDDLHQVSAKNWYPEWILNWPDHSKQLPRYDALTGEQIKYANMVTIPSSKRVRGTTQKGT